MEVFVTRLQEILEDKDITQRELAKLIGVTEVTISRYVSGERSPRVEIVSKIADILNVTTDYLLGRTDIKNPYEIQTIAAHHDGEEYTEEELEEIERFKEFVRMRKQQKNRK